MIDQRKKRARGHYKLFGYFKTNTPIPAGSLTIDSTRVFDKSKTYLKKYGIEKEENTLKTDVLYQKFHNKYNYDFRILSFQGLRSNDNSRLMPRALPLINVYYQNNIPSIKSKYYIDTNFLYLDRVEGPRYKRLSILNGLNTDEYITSGGHVFSADASLRTDFYYSDYKKINVLDHSYNNLNLSHKGGVSRIHPRINFEWEISINKSWKKF